MGKQIIVEVDGLSEAMKLGKEKFDPEKLILYFDGYPLDISAESIDSARNLLIFTPVRNDKNEKKWISLFGSSNNFVRQTLVSVGPSDQYGYAIPVDSSNQNFQFIFVQKNWFIGYVIALAIAILLFAWLAKVTNIYVIPIHLYLNRVKSISA